MLLFWYLVAIQTFPSVGYKLAFFLLRFFSLQSGTCPVCRRHFPPAVMETPAAASSEPDRDAPPANDSAAEAP